MTQFERRYYNKYRNVLLFSIDSLKYKRITTIKEKVKYNILLHKFALKKLKAIYRKVFDYDY